MLRIFIFNALFVGSCGYAFLRGGTPERMGAALLIANFELSLIALPGVASRYASFQTGVFLIDLALLGVLYVMCATTARYWPIWMAGLQGAVVLSHLLGAAPSVIAWVYSWAVAAWSYPMLVLLAAATRRHRVRLATHGQDPPWRWQLPVDYLNGATANDGNGRRKAKVCDQTARGNAIDRHSAGE